MIFIHKITSVNLLGFITQVLDFIQFSISKQIYLLSYNFPFESQLIKFSNKFNLFTLIQAKFILTRISIPNFTSLIQHTIHFSFYQFNLTQLKSHSIFITNNSIWVIYFTSNFISHLLLYSHFLLLKINFIHNLPLNSVYTFLFS